MDGIHDMGGMHGFGPVPITEENYVFKYDWQRRSFGLTQALAGATPFCADMHRYKIEQIPASDYLRMDYFEKWAIATSQLVQDAGLASAEELETGRKKFDVDLGLHPPASPEALVDAMMKGVEAHFPKSTRKAGFVTGQTVRVCTNAPAGHTRMPRYARGRLGKIVADMGVFQYADMVCIGKGPHEQHCYTVEFAASALWGESAETGEDQIYLDLAEAYLEHA